MSTQPSGPSPPGTVHVLGQRTPGPHLISEPALPCAVSSHYSHAMHPAEPDSGIVRISRSSAQKRMTNTILRSLRLQRALKTSLSKQLRSQLIIRLEIMSPIKVPGKPVLSTKGSALFVTKSRGPTHNKAPECPEAGSLLLQLL